MDKGILVKIFTESFDNRWKSPYGVVLSELLKKEDLILKVLSSQFLQEYSSQHATNSACDASR